MARESQSPPLSPDPSVIKLGLSNLWYPEPVLIWRTNRDVLQLNTDAWSDRLTGSCTDSRQSG